LGNPTIPLHDGRAGRLPPLPLDDGRESDADRLGTRLEHPLLHEPVNRCDHVVGDASYKLYRHALSIAFRNADADGQHDKRVAGDHRTPILRKRTGVRPSAI